jgi:hypothetical protein
LSNIRGSIPGNASIEGNLKPNINGRLFLNDAGLTVPYLNVDYALSDNTIIDLTDENSYSGTTLTDTNTEPKGN